MDTSFFYLTLSISAATASMCSLTCECVRVCFFKKLIVNRINTGMTTCVPTLWHQTRQFNSIIIFHTIFCIFTLVHSFSDSVCVRACMAVRVCLCYRRHATWFSVCLFVYLSVSVFVIVVLFHLERHNRKKTNSNIYTRTYTHIQAQIYIYILFRMGSAFNSNYINISSLSQWNSV